MVTELCEEVLRSRKGTGGEMNGRPVRLQANEEIITTVIHLSQRANSPVKDSLIVGSAGSFLFALGRRKWQDRTMHVEMNGSSSGCRSEYYKSQFRQVQANLCLCQNGEVICAPDLAREEE